MLKLPADVAKRNTELIATVDRLVEGHGRDREALLPILQDLRAAQGEISALAMELVADRLALSPAEVEGVVTFYAFLRTAPRSRHVIRLCRSLSCAMAGRDAVSSALETELGIEVGQATTDGAFLLEWANCLGLCDTPPAALIDGMPHGCLTAARVEQIVAALRKSDGPG